MAGVEYAIRDVVSAAGELEAAGRSIDYLNIGDPVQFGFQPPRNVREALVRAVREGQNFYAASEGLPELREAIAAKESAKGLPASGEDVLVTNGVSEALDMVIASVAEEGDEVLLQGPYYPPYASYARLHGAVPVEFATDPATGEPDVDDLRSKITPRTVAVCLISPGNPTGAVLSASSMRRVLDAAAEHGLYVVCDEIYDRITFEGRFEGVGAAASPDSPVVLLNGFSKSHLMSGWRAGYVCLNGGCAALDGLREHLPKLARVRISTSLPVQHAALESLRGPQGYVAAFVSEIRKRRDLVARRLEGIPGVSCTVPRGAFYAFPRIDDAGIRARFRSDRDFVLGLLREKGVLAVHGSGFGARYGSWHVRLVFLPGEDVLGRAMDGLEDFVREASRAR